MAQNPYSGGAGTVAPDITPPDDYMRVNANPEAFGASIARGMEQLGHGAVEAQKFYDQVAADDATNQLFQRWDKRMYGDSSKQVLQPDGTMGPDTGYMGLKGADALNRRQPLEKEMDADLAEIRKGLSTPEAQLKFDQDSRRYRMSLNYHVGAHAEGQYSVWAQRTNDAGARTALTPIQANPLDDEAFNRAKADLTTYRVKNVQLTGGGAERINAAVQAANDEALQARGAGISNVIQNYVEQGDLGRAQQTFERYKNGIDPQSANRISRFLQPRLENDEINRRVQHYIGQQPQTGPVSNVTPADRDAMIRTVIGEAGGEPRLGQEGVAWVIRNRQAAGFAPTVGGVVYQRGQFEPWMMRAGELRAISPDSPAYKRAAAVVDDVLSGKSSDPTSGATHFYSPSVQHALGRNDPQWAYEFNRTGKIGTHVFYRDPNVALPSDEARKMTDRLTAAGEEIPDKITYSKSEAIKRALEDSKDMPIPFQEKLISRISKFYNDRSQAYADERRALAQSVPDLIHGTLLGNENLAFPEAAILRAYPEKYAQWREQYDQAKVLGPNLRSAIYASPQDVADIARDIGSGQGWRSELLKSHLKDIGSPDPDGDYSKLKVTAAKYLDEIVKARVKGMQDDPAAFVADAPEVQEKAKALAAVPQNNQQGKIQAQLALWDASWKKQGEMGLPEEDRHVLSRDNAERVVSALQDPNMTPHALKGMQELQRAFGPQWDRAFKDLSTIGGLPSGYQSVMQLDPQNADLLARALREGTGGKDEKEKFSWEKALGKTASRATTGNVKSIIDDNIDNDAKVKQFRQSLTDQGLPAPAVESHIHDIKTLAYAHSFYKAGTDPGTAAESAKKAFMNDTEFYSGARVPADKFYQMRDAARAVSRAVNENTVSVPAIYSNPAAPRESSYAANASASMSWVNNQHNDGIVAIDHTGKIMHWKDGLPIEVKFDDPANWHAPQMPVATEGTVKVRNPF